MDPMKTHWKSFLFEGIVFTFLGCLAIALPWLMTLSIEIILGAIFLTAGAVQLFRTFQAHQVPLFLGSLFAATLLILVGLWLLANPFKGALALTALLAIFFLLEGIAKVIMAFQMRAHRLWGWYLFAGIISLLLAWLVWNQWPVSGVWFLGLWVGINMLFYGLSEVMVALQVRKSDS